MSSILSFKPRHPPPVQTMVSPASARSVHQAPIVRLSYVDESGRPQHATILGSSNLSRLADDPQAKARFLGGINQCLSALGGSLSSLHLVSSVCVEIEEGAEDHE